MPNLPWRKPVSKSGQQAGDVAPRPKLVVLGLTKQPPFEIQLPSDKLNSVLRQAAEKTGAAGVAIAFGSGATLHCRASAGMAPPVGTYLDPEAGFSGLCFRSGECLLCRDTEEDSRVDRIACRALGVRSALAVPLRKAGRSCGILELFSPQPTTFNESQIEAVRAIADLLIGTEPQPRLQGPREPQELQEKIGEFSREEAIGRAARFAREKHSPWLRMVIVASLLAAAVIGYRAKLKHSELQPNPPGKAAKTAAGTVQNAPPPTPTPIAAASVVHTEARIRGTFSGTDLAIVRARAAAGNARAAYDLGERYADGAGVAQDYQQAMEWFAKAAVKGNASAQWKLGLGYLKGIGVPQNESKAAAWFLQAANQAHIGAQAALSELYFSGKGVPRDYVRAYTWATIAAQTTNRNNEALKELTAEMTPEQLADARHRVAMWWEHRATPLKR